jgi:excisionase family DNA binding protein
MSTQPLLRPREVVERLAISRGTFYRLVHTGRLPALRLGESGQLRVEREVVDEFLRPARRESREP